MIELKVDTRDFERAMRKLGPAALDGTKPLSQLDAAVKADIGRQWTNHGKATGGTVRGVAWDKFKPQYTRKDGTVVEAWGGIPKVRGKGKVKGKKRPSDKRVTLQSIIGQDTGRFRRRLLASRPNIRNKNLLLIGGESLPIYAERLNELRPVIRWELPKDQQTFNKVAHAYLDGIAREANRGVR